MHLWRAQRPGDATQRAELQLNIIQLAQQSKFLQPSTAASPSATAIEFDQQAAVGAERQQSAAYEHSPSADVAATTPAELLRLPGDDTRATLSSAPSQPPVASAGAATSGL